MDGECSNFELHCAPLSEVGLVVTFPFMKSKIGVRGGIMPGGDRSSISKMGNERVSQNGFQRSDCILSAS